MYINSYYAQTVLNGFRLADPDRGIGLIRAVVHTNGKGGMFILNQQHIGKHIAEHTYTLYIYNILVILMYLAHMYM